MYRLNSKEKVFPYANILILFFFYQCNELHMCVFPLQRMTTLYVAILFCRIRNIKRRNERTWDQQLVGVTFRY